MTSNIGTQTGVSSIGSALPAHDFRAHVEHAIESLIALLDSIDAPGDDLEPEPLEDDDADEWDARGVSQPDYCDNVDQRRQLNRDTVQQHCG